MIATRIGSIRIVVCASPTYLEARGHPETARRPSNHDCITIDDVPRPLLGGL